MSPSASVFGKAPRFHAAPEGRNAVKVNVQHPGKEPRYAVQQGALKSMVVRAKSCVIEEVSEPKRTAPKKVALQAQDAAAEKANHNQDTTQKTKSRSRKRSKSAGKRKRAAVDTSGKEPKSSSPRSDAPAPAAEATAAPLPPNEDPVPPAESQTAPPESPRKSSRDPKNPWPKMSPDRKCAHNRYECFQEWNCGYYAPKRLEQMAGVPIPRFCAGVCKKLFVTAGYPGFEASKHWKVTKQHVVKCCPNGIDPEHKCDFGLCDPCYIMHVIGAEANKENSQPRKRAKRALLSPGEKMTQDGTIVASF